MLAHVSGKQSRFHIATTDSSFVKKSQVLIKKRKSELNFLGKKESGGSEESRHTNSQRSRNLATRFTHVTTPKRLRSCPKIFQNDYTARPPVLKNMF